MQGEDAQSGSSLAAMLCHGQRGVLPYRRYVGVLRVRVLG